jgi:hypothetical protein
VVSSRKRTAVAPPVRVNPLHDGPGLFVAGTITDGSQLALVEGELGAVHVAGILERHELADGLFELGHGMHVKHKEATMSIGLLFWVLMILWFISWLGTRWGPYGTYVYASELLFFILLFLLGWHAFGFVVHA